MSNKQHDAIYDVKELGTAKVLVLGAQHLFAMFGATVLVPILTGLDVSTTLLFAGIGTLLFHALTKGKVPAFLGSSFAFLGGYAAIAPLLEDGSSNVEMIPYACFGVACAGVLYLLMAWLIKIFSVKKIMRFFPPIVTGPIIIAIGLTLSQSAIDNCAANWIVALVAIAVVILCNIYGKGMIKIIPILLGVIASYVVGMMMGEVDFSVIANADWIGIPIHKELTVFGLFDGGFDSALLITSVVTIVPIALATIVEHIGDISAISSTTGVSYIKEPGLHRTLLGDGIATVVASLFGAPANTTYGENTGVLNLSKVYDPKVVRLAALFAIVLSFSPKVAAIIQAMPTATVGGISLILYGMISAVGVRNIVENKVDFTNSRNVIIAALILVLSIGVHYSAAGAIVFQLGSVTISLSGLAVGALTGIVLNMLLPGKDYEYEE
ncbi:MAG: uracil-xanthine permease family protein [Longicatena sp.]|nr:uracil-xanthine permease family protein [Longicatena sp.]